MAESARNALIALVIVGLIGLLAVVVFPPAAHAGCRSVAAVQVQTQFVAVPVAVPLGLPVYVSPVANAGLVQYGSAATKQADSVREAKSTDTPVPPSPDGKPYAEYLAEFAAYLSVKNGGQVQAQATQQPETATPAAKVSLVTTHCASCHNATKADGKLDLTIPLTADVRLKSIQRLLTDDAEKSMPKGKAITDEQRGQLIAELTGQP